MSKRFERALEAVRTWSEERQEDAAMLLEQMAADGTDVYNLTDEERADIEQGLEEARRVDLATDAEVNSMFKRHGLRRDDGLHAHAR